MRPLIFIICVVAFVNANSPIDDPPNVEMRITNGKVAPRNSHPWMASFQKDRFHECGGVLIRWDWVLTAAHCIKDLIQNHAQQGPLKEPYRYRVLLGAQEMLALDEEEVQRQSRSIKRAYLHPRVHASSKGTWDYDFALLNLDQRAWQNKPYVDTINLSPNTWTWNAWSENNHFARFVATGWGKTRVNGPPANDLWQINMNLYNHQQCREKARKIGFTVYNSHVCTEVVNGRDICQGDSGGPLVFGYENYGFYLVGIASGGLTYCGDNRAPALFASVDKAYTWIKNTMNGR